MKESIVLLHGALGSRETLLPLARGLAFEGPSYPVEFAGHGETPDEEAADGAPFSMDAFVAQLLAALDAAELERATVFGYSMGGYVALLAAARHPERIRGVLTLGTKLVWTPEVAAREVGRLDPATIRAKVPAFAEQLAARHEGAGGWERVLARTAGLLRGLGEAPPLTPAVLQSIACPVRIMVGDRDATVSLEECAHGMRALSRGELAVLPGTAHPLEQVVVGRVARQIVELHRAAG